MTSFLEHKLEKYFPPLLPGDILHIQDDDPKPLKDAFALLLEEPKIVHGVLPKDPTKHLKLKYIINERIVTCEPDVVMIYGLADIYRSGKKIWCRLGSKEVEKFHKEKWERINKK